MFKKDFQEHINKFNTTPFLFIGSGFSRRYLNTPTWEQLLQEMISHLNLSKPYEYYKSNSNSHFPSLATLIGEEFNEIWWSDEKFKLSREDFGKIARSKFSPIKYEISKYLENFNQVTKDDTINKEIKLLKKINIDGIITTNWDNFCELVFPNFNSFIGQEELIFSELYSIGEIYKIHGGISDPNSLVLTADDYQEFDQRNTYLAAKLLTLFIENPIIFIGYSLDDRNVQEILKSIVKCLIKDNTEKLRDRLIFCQWTPESIETKITDSSMLILDTIIPIKLIKLNNFIDLYTVLANNKKRIPIKVLRQMKGMVYDFVKNNKSKEKIYVADNLDNIENIHKAEFVYGFGIREKLSEIGIKGIELKEVLLDLIEDNNWDPDLIARLCLPPMQLQATYIPYFKYLRNAGYLNQDNEINEDTDVKEFSPQFIHTVNNINKNNFEPSESYRRKKQEINDDCESITDILNNYDSSIHYLMYIPLLDERKINVEELEKFLRDNIELINDSSRGTHYRKLICLFDYLKYKKESHR